MSIVGGYLEYRGEYLEYRGEYLEYREEYHNTCGEISSVPWGEFGNLVMG